MKINFLFSLLASLLAIQGCASKPIPVLAQTTDVKVSREKAGKTCQDLGPVTGKTRSSTATLEDAVEDLKVEAARKGANFVQAQDTGTFGGSIRGQAYTCE